MNSRISGFPGERRLESVFVPLFLGSTRAVYPANSTKYLFECLTQTYMNKKLLENVGREGSMRFDVLEPHPTSAYSTLTPSIPCKDAVREGSVQSNHPELM